MSTINNKPRSPITPFGLKAASAISGLKNAAAPQELPGQPAEKKPRVSVESAMKMKEAASALTGLARENEPPPKFALNLSAQKMKMQAPPPMKKKTATSAAVNNVKTVLPRQSLPKKTTVAVAAPTIKKATHPATTAAAQAVKKSSPPAAYAVSNSRRAPTAAAAAHHQRHHHVARPSMPHQYQGPAPQQHHAPPPRHMAAPPSRRSTNPLGWMWPSLPMRPPHMFHWPAHPAYHHHHQHAAQAHHAAAYKAAAVPTTHQYSAAPVRHQRRPVKQKSPYDVWTEDDDQRLIKLEAEYRLEHPAAAPTTHRYSSAPVRHQRLPVKQKSPYDEWTEDDDQRLKDLEAEYRLEQSFRKKQAWTLASNAAPTASKKQEQQPPKAAAPPVPESETSDDSDGEYDDDGVAMDAEVIVEKIVEPPAPEPVKMAETVMEKVVESAPVKAAEKVVANFIKKVQATKVVQAVKAKITEAAPVVKVEQVEEIAVMEQPLPLPTMPHKEKAAPLTAETIKQELMAAYPNIRKKRTTWTDEEDERLKSIVAALDPEGVRKCNWTDVARLMPERDSKQCRDRWLNHLDPALTKHANLPWTVEDDRKLIMFIKKHGTRWRLMQLTILPNRSELTIKNRWNSSMKRRYTRYLAEKWGVSPNNIQLLTPQGLLHAGVSVDQMLEVAQTNMAQVSRKFGEPLSEKSDLVVSDDSKAKSSSFVNDMVHKLSKKNAAFGSSGTDDAAPAFVRIYKTKMSDEDFREELGVLELPVESCFAATRATLFQRFGLDSTWKFTLPEFGIITGKQELDLGRMCPLMKRLGLGLGTEAQPVELSVVEQA